MNIFNKAALILLLFLCVPELKAQIIKTKLDVVGGISAREYYHVGLRYQYHEIMQLGIYYGGDIGMKHEIIRTYAIDNLIHFGNNSFRTNRPVWYGRPGFTYSSITDQEFIHKYSYVNLGLGREFGLTNWLSINLDAGLIWQIRHKKEWKDNPALPAIYQGIWHFFPLFRAQLAVSF